MATNVHVKVRKGEDVSKTIRRFKKKYEASGILRDLKRKRYHMKPSEAKRYKKAMAEKRRKKMARRKRNK